MKLNLMVCLALTCFIATSYAGAQSSTPEQKTFPPIDLQTKPQYAIHVNVAGEKLGTIVIELDPKHAPKTVRNFDSLVSIHFYDSTLFHRIVPDFVIQGGDPNTKHEPRERWGRGDSTQRKIPAEFNQAHHLRGTVAAARRGDDINSATSQFYICLDALPNLDEHYTVFGQVISGMEVVDSISTLSRDEHDRPVERVEMTVERVK